MKKSSLIVLAGGKSSRMKTNKAFLPINNTSLIETIINKLSNQFQQVIVVSNDIPSYSHLKAKIVPDIIPNCGPLSGIHAGLVKSNYSLSFVVACDMPFVSINLANHLISLANGFDVVVPIVKENYEALCAVYAKSCIPDIENNLEKGKRKVSSLYKQVKTLPVYEKELSKHCRVDQAFLNLNTPHDYRMAQRLLNA